MKLIDKDALIAEINRLKKKNDTYNKPSHIADVCYKELLSFIDTLEVKEVDLEKEIDNYIYTNNGRQRLALELDWLQCNITFKGEKLIDFAKHFFELGLSISNSTKVTTPNIDDVLKENGVNPDSKEAKIIKESYFMAIEKLSQKGEEV